MRLCQLHVTEKFTLSVHYHIENNKALALLALANTTASSFKTLRRCWTESDKK